MRGNGHSHREPVLIVGGAGFVGTNLACKLLDAGVPVRIFDNLSRPGVERNARYLSDRFSTSLLDMRVGDVRDRESLSAAVRDVTAVYHFAAQVAVTTSLDEPDYDFDVNLRGTLHVLEALRRMPHPPPLIFTSTNKVYGALHDVALVEEKTRYVPSDPRVAARGVDERRPLAFASPYACSKGGADQYVLDYANSYGLRSVVLRMSCIYGPHQYGNEDQGWIAHFLLRTLEGLPITVYGDGKQARDVLYVDDLVSALLLARSRVDDLSGCAFNIGGGVANSVSLIELLDRIGGLHGRPPDVHFSEWRRGDQRYYASDTSAFERATGWSVRTPVDSGLASLYRWLAREAGTRPERVAQVAGESGSESRVRRR